MDARATPETEAHLFEVWHDRVSGHHLALSVIAGIACGLGGFFVAEATFRSMSSPPAPDAAKGFSLLAGVLGCLAATILCAVLFPPKRVVLDRAPTETLGELLRDEGLSANTELRLLAAAPADTARELEEHGLLVAWTQQLRELATADSEDDK